MGRRSLTIRLKDGSGTITLKHLSRQKDRYGNERLYFRRGSKRVRIKSEEGTQAFLDEYYALFDGNAPAQTAAAPTAPVGRPTATASLGWLIREYYQSAEFKIELSERTQYVRRGILDAISRQDGEKPYVLMEPRHVRKLRDSKLDVPSTANSWVKALRRLFAWAVDAQGLSKNPATDVPYINVGGEGFHSWTTEEVQKYETTFPVGTMARLAFDLLLYTGVRRSDAVRLGPPMESDNGQALRFVVSKGERRHRKELELPIVPSLRKSIDATTIGKETYIISAYGRPFGRESFGNWFRDRCNEAGLLDCSAHGLRKAGATLAAERGASAHQLKAIFGWSSIKQAETYTRRADQRALAKSAMHLLDHKKDAD